MRCTVLAVTGVVVWTMGPGAWRGVTHAAAARTASTGAAVELPRVGFLHAPGWLRGPLLPELLDDIEPRLRGQNGEAAVGILDEPQSRAVRASVLESPWVVDARLERVFPDRLRLALDVRQPVLLALDGDGSGVALDRLGTCLPLVESISLPVVRLVGPWDGASAGDDLTPVLGRVHPDPRALAAVDVAMEWRDELLPLVPGAPELVEIDTFNLEERQMIGADHPDVMVLLERDDGLGVSFAWGRPPGTNKSRVPVATKAKVLRMILERYPGLRGLTAGDLRFVNRWESWLKPRLGPDPVGPEPPGA